ncbi:hypothetical protein, partial [Planomicrobium stackebrandtii]|uniref:hypothetical protein n=1 Tax=Planomicrobium stackebrandtii TaxID=253160 RepID=UPI00280C096D
DLPTLISKVARAVLRGRCVFVDVLLFSFQGSVRPSCKSNFSKLSPFSERVKPFYYCEKLNFS